MKQKKVSLLLTPIMFGITTLSGLCTNWYGITYCLRHSRVLDLSVGSVSYYHISVRT